MTHTSHTRGGGTRLPATAALPPRRAAPAAQARRPRSSLRRRLALRSRVTRGDARSGDTRGTLLLCDPPQGHAPRGRGLRANSRAADGDIGAIPHRDAICPMLYAPVTAPRARASGTAARSSTEQTFSNACVMGARTGAVFALDG